MYNKGDLRKLVSELRKQGVEVIRDGSVYRIYAKIKCFGGLTLRQTTDKLGVCHVRVMTGYWDDGCTKWDNIEWSDVLKQVNNYILVK